MVEHRESEELAQEMETYLRAILLTADHMSYHVGQLVAVRRALGIWPGA